MPDFGKIDFSHSKIGSIPFGAYAEEGLPVYRYQRYNRTETTLEISVSKFAENNEDFVTTFKASS